MRVITPSLVIYFMTNSTAYSPFLSSTINSGPKSFIILPNTPLTLQTINFILYYLANLDHDSITLLSLCCANIIKSYSLRAEKCSSISEISFGNASYVFN